MAELIRLRKTSSACLRGPVNGGAEKKQQRQSNELFFRAT